MKLFQVSPRWVLKLFLISIWPQHTWTIYMVFRDLGWVAQRTTAGDAFGLLSYALIFALGEGAILFILILLIDLTLLRKWPPDKRLSILTIALFDLSLWAIIPQLFSLADIHLPNDLESLIIASGHPLWVLYGFSLGSTALSIGLPIYWIFKRPETVGWINLFVDRLVVLSSLYLFLDMIGIINVIIRNLN